MANGDLDVQIAFISVKFFQFLNILLIFFRQQTAIIHDPGNRIVPRATLPNLDVLTKLLVAKAQLRVIRWFELQFSPLHTELFTFTDNIPHRAAHPLTLYLDGVIAFLAVFFLKQFLISVHPGRVELLALDHLELFQEFAFFDGEIFRIHQVRQGRISNRLLWTQLTPQQKELHIRHQRKSPNLKSKFDSILAHQFRTHLHILETTCFHQCHHVFIGTALKVHVTSLETNVGIHITLGHITEPRNVHGDLRDIALGEQ